MIICVTGTNTDVGKTVATAALAAALQEAGVDVAVAKPVQTGEAAGSGDVATVERLTGIVGEELRRYPEPLAPNLAARRAGMAQVGRAELVEWIRERDIPGGVLLVEGAGGLLVRLADELTLADAAADLGAPLVLVTSLGLGSLNAAELTVQAARSRGVQVLGLIGGALVDAPDLATRLNLEELPAVTGAPLWGCLPAGCGGMAREEFRACAVAALGEAVAAVKTYLEQA